MNVGEIVRLNLPGPAGDERFRIMGILSAMPMERGPLLLRLKSKTDGRIIFDYPSSHTTKEDQ